MSHQKFVTGLVLLLMCVSFGVKAQEQVGSTPMSGKDMHSVMPGMEMGRLEGDLFAIDSTGEKKFLPDHEVMIKVYRQNDELLSLNKKTDEKGHFIFKNIFKDPAFEYALGFYHEGQLFVMNGLKLEKGKDAVNVDFRVGEGSPYLVPEEIVNAQMEQPSASQGMSGMPSGQASKANKTTSGSLKQSPQKVVALFLFLVVLVAFLYLMKRQSHKRAMPSGDGLASSAVPKNFQTTGAASDEKDLFLISWLHEKYTKGEISESVYRAQEAKILEKLNK